MTVLTWIIAAVLLFLTIFAVANWTLLIAPASLNFLLFEVQGPLGLTLFVALLGFAALLFVYALSLRTRALLESGRHLKELEAQRQVAERAEASRLAALTEQVGREFGSVRAEIAQSRAAAQESVEQCERRIALHIDEVSNAIFANIGQVDDKLNGRTPRGAS